MKTKHRHASTGYFLKLVIFYLETSTAVILLNKEIWIGNLNIFLRFRVEKTYSTRTKQLACVLHISTEFQIIIKQ